MKKLLISLIIIAPFLLPQEALATITASTTIFTATGYRTYTVSANACTTNIAAWGAGGGGAIGASTQGGAGGGGGGFASSTITTTPGDTIRIYVAPSTATEVNGATTTASTTAPTLIVGASGGTAATAATGALGGMGSIGDVTANGGSGGSATTGNGDESGGGGGAGGPHGVGGNGGTCTSSTVGCGGGASNSGSSGTDNTVTAGTAVAGTSGADGGRGDDTTTPDAVGANGTYGGGGGGGADDNRQGSAGGSPGGGGGGSEITGAGGAAGQITVTEFVDDTGCVDPPTLSTDAASSVTSFSALLNGQITATGGADVTVRGFAWGTNSTLSNGDTSTTTDTAGQPFGTGAFTQLVSGLIAGRTYYFRAYATNSQGTGFDATSPILSLTASAADTTLARRMRLFEGFTIKLLDGRIILHQQ